MQTRLASAALAFLTVSSPVLASTWEIDPAHSQTSFTVKHMMVSTVRGEFGKTSGTVELDDKDPAKSRINATIDASTINTREEKRDAHLKSPDFFDVAKYPTITFQSKNVKKAGTNKYKVIGDLAMHGVTKEVTLDVETNPSEVKDPMGQIKRGAVATTKINRKDYGLNWNKALEAGGMLVSDDVNIELNLQFAKKAPMGTGGAAESGKDMGTGKADAGMKK